MNKIPSNGNSERRMSSEMSIGKCAKSVNKWIINSNERHPFRFSGKSIFFQLEFIRSVDQNKYEQTYNWTSHCGSKSLKIRVSVCVSFSLLPRSLSCSEILLTAVCINYRRISFFVHHTSTSYSFTRCYQHLPILRVDAANWCDQCE